MSEKNQIHAKSDQDSQLAVSARQLAALLNVSLRQVWRLNAAGKLPRPVRLGGSIRWDRQEIIDWFKAGCPERKVWDASMGVTR
jgi:prophage regulatory protein